MKDRKRGEGRIGSEGDRDYLKVMAEHFSFERKDF